MLRRVGLCSMRAVLPRSPLYEFQRIPLAYYCVDGKHSDKIKKARSTMKRKKQSDKKTNSKPSRADLRYEISASKPRDTEGEDYDSDLNNPEIMEQVRLLEEEHYKIHGRPEEKPKDKKEKKEKKEIPSYVHDYDVERIAEGERTEDEEEEELQEIINTSEPAFTVKEYADQLSKVKNIDDLRNIDFYFTTEDYVRMLEAEHAEDINVIDIRNKSDELDYLILATMHSNRHRRATAHFIYLQTKKRFQLACEYGSLFVKQFLLSSPYEQARRSKDSDEWVTVDCGDIGIHLFSPETRKEYDLDGFWTNEMKDYDSEEELRNLEKNEAFLLQDIKRGSRTQSQRFDKYTDTPLGESSDDERYV